MTAEKSGEGDLFRDSDPEHRAREQYQSEIEAQLRSVQAGLKDELSGSSKASSDEWIGAYVEVLGNGLRATVKIPQEIKRWAASLESAQWAKLLKDARESLEDPLRGMSVDADSEESRREVISEHVVLLRDRAENLKVALYCAWIERDNAFEFAEQIPGRDEFKGALSAFLAKLETEVPGFIAFSDALSVYEEKLRSEYGLKRESARRALGDRRFLLADGNDWTSALGSIADRLIDYAKLPPDAIVADYIENGDNSEIAEWVEQYAQIHPDFAERLVFTIDDFFVADEPIGARARQWRSSFSDKGKSLH